MVLAALTTIPAANGQSAQQFWRNEYRRQHDGYRAAPRWNQGWGRGNGSRYDNGGYDNGRYSSDDGYGFWDRPGWDAHAYVPEQLHPTARYDNPPHVEISSPQYYDYKPDRVKSVTFDKLCQTKVAANTDAPTIDGAAPATPPSALPGTLSNLPAPGSSFEQACLLSPDITLRVLPEVGQALTSYYSAHQHLIWSARGSISARARQAMKALAASDQFGLVPADYEVALPSKAGDPQERLKDLLRFDLALSGKVLTYVLDARRGRVDPDRISGYHDIARKQPDLVAALGDIAKSDDVAGYLAHSNPDNAPFRAMVTALAQLRGSAPREPIRIADGTTIHPGESSLQLANVLAALRRHASPPLKHQYADTLAGGTPDTYRGKLVELIRDFQREHDLPADGVIGPNTIAAMTDNTVADKIEKVRLAMERMRWLPRKFGNQYVFLNEPAFEVTYVEPDGKRLTMPVIIGRKSRQTYFFTDKIEAVEYNPYWDVPRSIVINEMLPHLYRDPYYLDREGYEVTDARGRRVSSASVNWARYARNEMLVHVRQPPGPRNALGRLKIKFPNKHAIYMHDTPKKSLFRRAQRSFSHGCVRLKQPRVMAAALLGKPVSYVDRRIAQGDNEVEPITVDIPVYLTYFTAWPDADGAMHYYADVYGRDRHLAVALKKTEREQLKAD